MLLPNELALKQGRLSADCRPFVIMNIEEITQMNDDKRSWHWRRKRNMLPRPSVIPSMKRFFQWVTS